MVVELIVVGKTTQKEVADLVEMYATRLRHYVRFSITTLPDIRGGGALSEGELKRAEGEAILKSLQDGDWVVLLDERGDRLRSVEFAAMIERRMIAGDKRLVFVIGGAFGFSDSVYGRSNAKLSLSPMTFSHQIVRALFAEQLYRAFTIIRHEKYHHE